MSKNVDVEVHKPDGTVKIENVARYGYRRGSKRDLDPEHPKEGQIFCVDKYYICDREDLGKRILWIVLE